MATNTFTINSLTANMPYVFKVRASNLYGNGQFSSDFTQYTIRAPAAMSAPVLVMSSGSNTLVQITWTKPVNYTSEIDKYDLQVQAVDLTFSTVSGCTRTQDLVALTC